jgi:hypothetical protein
MNEPPDFDDGAIQALVAGNGRDIDPRVADFIGDLRVAYATLPPTPNPELAALMTAAPPTLPSLVGRRLAQLRSSTLAKIGAATALLVAATGGLGVAHALPAPVQDAIAHLGIGAPPHSNSPLTHSSTTTIDATTTTAPGGSTPPTANANPKHGQVVSGVAHDHNTTGCGHGAAVSNTASDGRTHNDTHDRSCNPPTPTTTDNNHGGDNHVGSGDGTSGHRDNNHSSSQSQQGGGPGGSSNGGGSH